MACGCLPYFHWQSVYTNLANKLNVFSHWFIGKALGEQDVLANLQLDIMFAFWKLLRI